MIDLPWLGSLVLSWNANEGELENSREWKHGKQQHKATTAHKGTGGKQTASRRCPEKTSSHRTSSVIFHFGQVQSFVQSLKCFTRCSHSFAASTTKNTSLARNVAVLTKSSLETGTAQRKVKHFSVECLGPATSLQQAP